LGDTFVCNLRQQHLGAMVFSSSTEEVIPGLHRRHCFPPMAFCSVNSNHDSALSLDGTRARKSVYSTFHLNTDKKKLTLLTWKMEGRGVVAFTGGG